MNATKKTEKTVKRGRKNAYIPEMIEIGRRLAEARDHNGVTQARLAGKLGTSAQALGQVEQGWRAPTVPWLARAARALGVDLPWILTGIDPALARAVDRVVKGQRKAKKTG